MTRKTLLLLDPTGGLVEVVSAVPPLDGDESKQAKVDDPAASEAFSAASPLLDHSQQDHDDDQSAFATSSSRGGLSW